MRIKQLIVCLFSFLIILFVGGCTTIQSTPEKIHKVLEDVVEKEQLFEKQQAPLVQLEKDEQKLYGEIMNLGTKNMNSIVEKADQAIEIVNKRKTHIDNEQKSLVESEDTFKKIKSLIEELEDKQAKEKGERLYSIMVDRYQTHDQLYKAYIKGLEKDRQLYNMLKTEERSLGELEEQIVKINEVYEEVMVANEKFNDLTVEYNETKHEFYELLGLEIEEESTK